VADKAYITVKIDIEEASRRVLIEHYRSHRNDLVKVIQAAMEAEAALDGFMRTCGLLDEVKLISASPEKAVQE
jgi:hypothetical protein